MPGNAASGMTGDISQLHLGICAGALLAMAAAMLRAPRPTARWTGFAFFVCSALFAIKLWNDQRGGSVSLNRFRGWGKWISASFMLPPGLAAAG